MEKLDDFIEVDDSEILTGDQHLKIQSPITEVKRKPEIEIETTKANENDPELIDIPDDLGIEKDDDEDKDIVIKKVVDKKVKEKEKEVDNDDDKSNEEVKFDNEYVAFASSLNDGGFFPDLEDEELVSIKDEEDLQEKLAKQLNITFKTWQDSYKESLVDNLVREGIISKDNVKKDFVTEYSKSDITGNLELAKQVHIDYGRRKGLSDKQIQRLINSTEDLEESALELYDENEEFKKQNQRNIAAKLKEQEVQVSKQREVFTEQLKKNTFEYDEFIPGRKLKKQDKEEVFLNIEPTLKKINSDLAKYAPMLAYLDRYGILEGKFDKLLKEGQTQAVSSLQQILLEKKKGPGASEKSRSGVINIDDSGVKKIYK